MALKYHKQNSNQIRYSP